jgi:hypothetical protein
MRQVLGSLIVVASVALWIGLPVGGLWVAGQLTDDAEVFLFIALGGIPLAMVACGWVIYRLNALYVDLHDEEDPFPLTEVAMTASAVVALVLMLLWFFFLAEYRLVTPP